MMELIIITSLLILGIICIIIKIFLDIPGNIKNNAKKIKNQEELESLANKWVKKLKINKKIKYKFLKHKYLFKNSKAELLPEGKSYIITISPFLWRNNEAILVHELLHIKKGHLELIRDKLKDQNYFCRSLKKRIFNFKFDREINKKIIPRIFENRDNFL